MITGWTIYWIGILNGIIDVGIVLTAISAGLSVVGTIALIIVSVDKEINYLKVYRKYVVLVYSIFIISLISVNMIPSSKHAAAILLIPPVANGVIQNEQIQALPNNIATLANDWIKTLSPKDANSAKEKSK